MILNHCKCLESGPRSHFCHLLRVWNKQLYIHCNLTIKNGFLSVSRTYIYWLGCVSFCPTWKNWAFFDKLYPNVLEGWFILNKPKIPTVILHNHSVQQLPYSLKASQTFPPVPRGYRNSWQSRPVPPYRRTSEVPIRERLKALTLIRVVGWLYTT